MGNWENNISDHDAEKLVLSVFKRDHKVIYEPSPEVLAHTMTQVSKAKRKNPQHRNQYRSVMAFASASLAVAVIVTLSLTNTKNSIPSFNASTNQVVKITVQMEALPEAQIASVEISLPDGVKFYSNKYPELMEKQKLELAFDEDLKKAQLPFFIKADKSGHREVKVRFLDSNHNLVAERSYNFDFKNGEASGVVL